MALAVQDFFVLDSSEFKFDLTLKKNRSPSFSSGCKKD